MDEIEITNKNGTFIEGKETVLFIIFLSFFVPAEKFCAT